MTPLDFRQLVVASIKTPAVVARSLIAMKFETGVLWNALLLVAVANTFLFSLSNIILPGASPLPGIFSVPFVYFAIVSGGLALTALSIFWTGRLMGGTGALGDILVLIVWLQILRVLVQIVVLVLVLVLPLLSALLVIASGLVGMYILVHFVDQAHNFGSPGRAAAALIASLVVIVVGLSVVLALIGGPYVGSSLNV